jgi:hypothetical protein
MALSKWKPTDAKIPSSSNRGESTTASIHTSVGKALSEWEHMESGLTRLFQLFCESPSFAAARAYGTIESSFSKSNLLRAAMEVFFASRDAIDSELYKDSKSLLSAYQKGQEYRNNIAHGIAVGFRLKDGPHSGYFLCPPSYATKKVAKINPREIYLLGASYWYKADDILHYSNRYTEILAETMRLIQDVNQKYRVLKNEQFHP